VFIGRSNSGKSSLINAIYDMDLSNVSKQPGTTKALYLYPLRSPQGYAVDTPGYGFANINLKMRSKYKRLIQEYLKKSTRISRVYCLINMEHGIKELDFEFLHLLEDCKHNFQVVLSKSDKVKQDYLFDKTIAIGQQLKQFKFASPILHVASAKKLYGIDFLRDSVVASNKEFYSKRELQELKDKQKRLLFAAKKNPEIEDNLNSSQITFNVPPPSEMYRLLIKNSSK